MSSNLEPSSDAATAPAAPDTDASSPDYDALADGGTSKPLTQGEIIFVTVMSFVVTLALGLGAYAYFQRRKNKKRQQQQKANQQRRASDPATTDMVIDIEGLADHRDVAAAVGCAGDDDAAAAAARRNNSLHAQRSAPTMQSELSRNGSLGKVKSKASAGPRRVTMEDRAMDRGTVTVGSDVPNHYKRAAIEHMNQLSHAGV